MKLLRHSLHRATLSVITTALLTGCASFKPGSLENAVQQPAELFGINREKTEVVSTHE